MRELEQLLGLFVAGVILAAGARRVGAPYPVFLALGGALLALLPVAPSFNVPPQLALALFVAPVLLDAAYDASLRDLRDNWLPVTGLVVFAVGFTTVAVAVVTHALIPTIPWAAAVALGAVVAPPDAVRSSSSNPSTSPRGLRRYCETVPSSSVGKGSLPGRGDPTLNSSFIFCILFLVRPILRPTIRIHGFHTDARGCYRRLVRRPPEPSVFGVTNEK
jgi:hypothetical protein